jgi:hypothetical protein
MKTASLLGNIYQQPFHLCHAPMGGDSIRSKNKNMTAP